MQEDLGDNLMKLGMLNGLLDDEGNFFLYWLVKSAELPRVNFNTSLEDGPVTYGWAKKRDPVESTGPAKLSEVERQMIEETIIIS